MGFRALLEDPGHRTRRGVEPPPMYEPELESDDVGLVFERPKDSSHEEKKPA